MSETINNQQVFSLLEVTRSIEKTISARYKSTFWVKAEMIKLNHYSYSGHAYPDLVEKKNGKVVAQIRSTLWSSRFEEINRRFLNITKEPLKDGINIMFRAQIKFSPLYGLSINIIDIDPSVTLGDMEREKQATISKLKEEAIFDNNKKRLLPLLPQRLAIISVETSKGYADFINVIDANSWGYRFFHMLFPSLLQGDQAVASIMKQLNSIKRVKHHFDLVAIIRGGGGDVGLSCYNNFELSKEIALFPIPVFTGIGHSTNETVVEMVSHTNNITPTKLAEFLIQKFHNFNVPVQESQRIISEFAIQTLKDTGKGLSDTSKYFQSVTQGLLFQNKEKLQNEIRNLSNGIPRQLEKSRNKLEEKEWQVQILDPVNVLERGYSITYLNGKALHQSTDVNQGDMIETRLFNGKLESIVRTTNLIKWKKKNHTQKLSKSFRKS